MMLKSVTVGKSRFLIAGVLAAMTQTAWSDESQPADATDAARKAEVREQVEADVRVYIEALNQRLAEQLARDLDAIGAPRVELVISEVPTRG